MPGRRLGAEHAQLSSWHFASNSVSDDINSVEEVNEVGRRFVESRDPDDAQFLLKAFHNYLLKYMGLLATGKIAAEGTRVRHIPADTRRFLALFMSPGVRPTFGEFARTADRLPNACLWMSADDIYNELALIFLELANKFDGRGGFVGFIQFRFAWAVKTRLFQIQRNPLNYQPAGSNDPRTYSPDATTSTEWRNAVADRGKKGPANRRFQAADGDSRVLLGFKLTPTFISLPPPPFDRIWSPLQRAIVYHKYAEDMPCSAIAEKLGMSGGPAVIREELRNALAIFKKFCPNG
jgi:hypothetical protein